MSESEKFDCIFFQSLLIYCCKLVLLRMTRGARNPNPQVVITLHCMYVASIHLDFIKNEWHAENAILSCMFQPSTPHNLIVHVLTVCHLKLTQGTALERNCFDLRSLSPTLPNLWLLLVII